MSNINLNAASQEELRSTMHTTGNFDESKI